MTEVAWLDAIIELELVVIEEVDDAAREDELRLVALDVLVEDWVCVSSSLLPLAPHALKCRKPARTTILTTVNFICCSFKKMTRHFFI